MDTTSRSIDETQDEMKDGEYRTKEDTYSDSNDSDCTSSKSSGEHDIIDDGVIIEKMKYIGRVRCFFHDK